VCLISQEARVKQEIGEYDQREEILGREAKVPMDTCDFMGGEGERNVVFISFLLKEELFLKTAVSSGGEPA
jgi:hypothetical protein